MSNTSSREIVPQQQSMGEAMEGWPPVLRTGVGLIGSATLAFYIPTMVLTFFGLMINTLVNWKVNAICITVLMLVNVVGLRLKNPMATALVCAIGLDLYILTLAFRLATSATILYWLMQLLMTSLCFLLNAYFLNRFRETT